jgi:4-azaleucine resistance transporter AzlC
MNREFKLGFTANLPVAASVAAYGSVLGVLAAQQGVSWLQLVMMNLAIFAGSAQFVLMDMWSPPLPVFEMVLAVAVINLRYLLIGASLQPVFKGHPIGHTLGMLHFTADENWAITMAARRKGAAGPWHLFGGGVCMALAWGCGTLGGLFFGAAIANPEAYALDFAFTAVFLALALGLWRGKGDIIPWTAAVGLAVISEHYIPGKWYILIGGLGGAIAAMFLPAPQEEAGSDL